MLRRFAPRSSTNRKQEKKVCGTFTGTFRASTALYKSADECVAATVTRPQRPQPARSQESDRGSMNLAWSTVKASGDHRRGSATCSIVARKIMTIHALFETWSIDDGNYPDMHVGMRVKLAFIMNPARLETGAVEYRWLYLNGATYRFSGKVTERYEEPDPIVVIDAGTMRFACEGPSIAELRAGDRVTGEGDLVVDYYIWSENVADRLGAENLFYDFVVSGLKRVDEAAADGLKFRILRATDVTSTRERRSSEVFLFDLEPSPDSAPRTFT
jgi:hypothetical protein